MRSRQRWPLAGLLVVLLVVARVLATDRAADSGSRGARPAGSPGAPAPRQGLGAAGPPGWLVLSPSGDVASPAPLIAVATPGVEGPIVIDVRLADGRGFRATTVHRALPWPETLAPLAVGATGRIVASARGRTLGGASFRRVAPGARPQGLANARLPAPRQW